MLRCFPILLLVSTAFGQYSVSVIPVPSGMSGGEMVGINASGQVAGNLVNGAQVLPFLGSPSGSALNPLLPGWTFARASALNDAGQVAGGGGPTNLEAQPFVGNPSGISLVPAPASPAGASGINSSGQVAGTIDQLGQPAQGFVGNPEGVSLIPPPAGFSNTLVGGLNNYGQVTGVAPTALPVQQSPQPVFIGTAAGTTLIPLPNGWPFGISCAINDSGQVAGLAGPNYYPLEPFIGTASGSELIPLPPGATNIYLESGCLNNAGQVVGWSDAGGWIWDSVNGTRLLNSLVPAGWKVIDGISISNNGIVLAIASYNQGLQMYVELSPVPASGCTYSITPPAGFFSANASGGSVNVNTQPGCEWTVSSNSSWLAVGSSSGGVGSGTASFEMNSNPGSANRVGVVTVGGQTFPVTQDAASVVSPLAPMGVVPGAGSGTTQTFTLTFTDEAHATDLKVLDVLINNYLDGQQACYFALVPSGTSSGYLYLVDDAGDGGYVSGTPILLSSAGTVQNSQCSITAAGSSLSMIGNNLTLVLTINFKPAFAGNRIFYVAARSNSQNSGWQALGTWNVPGSSTSGPAVAGASPGRVTTTGGTYLLGLNLDSQQDGVYSFTFTDTNGYADISVVDILINAWLDGTSACYSAFVPQYSSIYLVDDAGDGGYAANPISIASNDQISNSQCSVNAPGSSMSANGNILTLKLNISFTQTFKGNQIIYVAARNNTGENSGWQAVGTVTIP